MEMNANKTHVVHSGRYLMNMSAIWTHENMRKTCCSINGPFQCMANMPTIPKFQRKSTIVNRSMTRLNSLKTSLIIKLNN
jgi:hypothetical protein